MSTALFINGMFESILDVIHKVQQAVPEKPCYLQPYAAGRIRFLAKTHPTPEQPITVYFSLTGSLGLISYRGKINGWRDKRHLSEAELDLLNQQMKDTQ